MLIYICISIHTHTPQSVLAVSGLRRRCPHRTRTRALRHIRSIYNCHVIISVCHGYLQRMYHWAPRHKSLNIILLYILNMNPIFIYITLYILYKWVVTVGARPPETSVHESASAAPHFSLDWASNHWSCFRLSDYKLLNCLYHYNYKAGPAARNAPHEYGAPDHIQSETWGINHQIT